MTEPLQHFYRVKGVRQPDGTITWNIELDDRMDDGNIWDPNLDWGEWRFPETDAETAEAGAVTGDLLRRLAN